MSDPVNSPTPIDTVEDAVLARVEAICGNKVATGSLPTRFAVAELKARVRQTPGIFVSFLGGAAINSNDAAIDAEVVVHFAMSNARGEEARRRGDVNKSGAYQLLSLVVPGLQGLFIDGIGSLSLTRIDNLFSDDLDRQGVSLYAAVFTVPMSFGTPDPANIAGFLAYHADIVEAPLTSPAPVPPMAPNSGQVATDQVILEGDSA